MFSHLKKSGLWLVSTVLLGTIVLLPFHYHSETPAKTSPHCAVCQLSNSFKATTPAVQSGEIPASEPILSVVGAVVSLPTINFFPSTFPRAPPSSLS